MSNETQATQLEISIVCFIWEKKVKSFYFIFGLFLRSVTESYLWKFLMETSVLLAVYCIGVSSFFLFITHMMLKNRIDNKCTCIKGAVSLCPLPPTSLKEVGRLIINGGLGIMCKNTLYPIWNCCFSTHWRDQRKSWYISSRSVCPAVETGIVKHGGEEKEEEHLSDRDLNLTLR